MRSWVMFAFLVDMTQEYSDPSCSLVVPRDRQGIFLAIVCIRNPSAQFCCAKIINKDIEIKLSHNQLLSNSPPFSTFSSFTSLYFSI